MKVREVKKERLANVFLIEGLAGDYVIKRVRKVA